MMKFTWFCCFIAFIGTTSAFSFKKTALLLISHSEDKDVHQTKNTNFGTILDLRRKRDVREPSQQEHIESMVILTKVTNRFAETVATAIIKNPTQANIEVSFTLFLPETAFISNFSMVIDGERIISDVMPKDEAEKRFEEAKSQNKTAGKVSSEQAYDKPVQPNGMEEFTIVVHVKAESSVEMDLSYLEQLYRELGVYELAISMRPNQIIKHYQCDILIFDKQEIDFVSIFEPYVTSNALTQYEVAKILNETPHARHIQFAPSEEEQKAMGTNNGINGDLRVSYDVKHDETAGIIQIEDEYFAHHFSPNEASYSPLGKNIVFVIDISGSMGSENKMLQTREAMRTILNQLRSIDTFMLLLFDDALAKWPKDGVMINATPDNIQAASIFAERELVADGGTNINDALVNGCYELRANEMILGSNMMVFLTDGEATVGEMVSKRIVANVERACGGKVSIYSLAFGYSLDYELLKMVSFRTGGKAQRIYVDGSAKKQLEDFYENIGTPILYNVNVYIPENSIIPGSVTQTQFNQFFKGSELVIAGKLSQTLQKDDLLEITVNGQRSKDDTRTITKQATVEEASNIDQDAAVTYSPGYLKRMYAYLKIKDLLKKMIMVNDETEQKQYEAEALQLALENNLVTPLTSLFVVQPDRPELNLEDDIAYGSSLDINYRSPASSGHISQPIQIFIFWVLLYSFDNFMYILTN